MDASDRLRSQYDEYVSPYVELLAAGIQDELTDILAGYPTERITYRIKGTDSFLAKAGKTDKQTGAAKYPHPLKDITDIIGVRIVMRFLSEVDQVVLRIKEAFNTTETEVKEPDDMRAFGYFGTHLMVLVPPDLLLPDFPKAELPDKFELQIKTVFQHAWAEAEHDITYKATYPWTEEQKRQIAFTAAQAWGADKIFDELYCSGKANNS
jgi:putative GTP pyrophosphokinase